MSEKKWHKDVSCTITKPSGETATVDKNGRIIQTTNQENALFIGKKITVTRDRDEREINRQDGWGDNDSRPSSSSSDDDGGCFLTTACVEHAGLSDDCHELTTMRKFRDSFVMSIPGGYGLIESYYRIAPGLVSRINADHDRISILDGILCTVRRIVGLIESGHQRDAVNAYQGMVNDLQKKFA